MREFWMSVLKVIVVILSVFSVPFIFPIMLKLFLRYNIFANADEFKDLMNIFNNVYVLIYMGIVIVLLLWFFHKWESIKEYLKHLNISFACGDKKISANCINDEIIKNNERKEFMSQLKNKKNCDSEDAKNETKLLLNIINDTKNSSTKKQCKECDKEELQKENCKLRDFAAYNIINTETKSLLHIIYNENYIDTDKFKSRIIQGYKRRNRKNVKFTKKEMDKIAKNKYDAIFDGLKFLNIIEPSEDDKTIKLTKEGKNFVEKYIEKEGAV